MSVRRKRYKDTNPKKPSVNRVHWIKGYCIACWNRFTFEIKYSDMEGKTTEEIRLMCQTLHATAKPWCEKPNVRLY